MCCFKSVIILKDDIFVPNYDSHTMMLEELGIKDTTENAVSLFVRAELIPKNDNVFIPIKEWDLHIDQDILPEWFVTDIDKIRVQKAVQAWAEKHIFINKKNLIFNNNEEYFVKDCDVIAGCTSHIHAYGNSNIKARGHSIITIYNNSQARAYDFSSISAYDNATVIAYERSRIRCHDKSEVRGYDNAYIVAQNNCKIEVSENSFVSAYDNSQITSFDNSIVEGYNCSKIMAFNFSTIKLYNFASIVAADQTVVILAPSPAYLCENPEKDITILNDQVKLINLSDTSNNDSF